MQSAASTLSQSATPTPGPAAPFHLHIENLSSQHALFHITPDILAVALNAVPALKGRLRVSYGFDLDSFDTNMADADGFIGWRFPTDAFRQRAPKLRFIQLTGAGLEHLTPLSWVPDGVFISNNRGVHAAKAGEFAMMALLMLNSRMPRMATSQHCHLWEKAFTGTIVGKTLLVLGVGNMGGAAAGAGKALGMRVIGISRTPRPHESVDEMFATSDLAVLLPRADILAICTPLTGETNGLLGREALSRLKPGAAILNIGRGAVMDTDALADMLRAGHISGAILDVFDPEPLPSDSPLWEVPGLTITPHCSSDDLENYARLTAELALHNVQRLLEGREPLNPVDRTLGY